MRLLRWLLAPSRLRWDSLQRPSKMWNLARSRRPAPANLSFPFIGMKRNAWTASPTSNARSLPHPRPVLYTLGFASKSLRNSLGSTLARRSSKGVMTYTNLRNSFSLLSTWASLRSQLRVRMKFVRACKTKFPTSTPSIASRMLDEIRFCFKNPTRLPRRH